MNSHSTGQWVVCCVDAWGPGCASACFGAKFCLLGDVPASAVGHSGLKTSSLELCFLAENTYICTCFRKSESDYAPLWLGFPAECLKLNLRSSECGDSEDTVLKETSAVSVTQNYTLLLARDLPILLIPYHVFKLMLLATCSWWSWSLISPCKNFTCSLFEATQTYLPASAVYASFLTPYFPLSQPLSAVFPC